MKRKKIVVALGHKALGTTLPEQKAAVKRSAKVIADLVAAGADVVITHSNAPQVGMIHMAMNEFGKMHTDYSAAPMSVCSAMSEGYIGYDLQNALREEMLGRGISKGVSTVLTQVEVDREDPAFQNPTKPIGAFMTAEEARHLTKERGYTVIEDSGRGYRRVVSSPMPRRIIEIDSIRDMVEAGLVVIACGGGGIPVFRTEGYHLKGAAAVIDKDFASALLADKLGADRLIILTAVEKVCINFGREDQQELDCITVEQAEKYALEGQFGTGSMLPKVEASVQFVSGGEGREALITLLEKAGAGVRGETGTRIIRQ